MILRLRRVYNSIINSILLKHLAGWNNSNQIFTKLRKIDSMLSCSHSFNILWIDKNTRDVNVLHIVIFRPKTDCLTEKSKSKPQEN